MLSRKVLAGAASEDIFNPQGIIFPNTTGDKFNVVNFKDTPALPAEVGSATSATYIDDPRCVAYNHKQQVAFVTANDDDMISAWDMSDPTAPAYLGNITNAATIDNIDFCVLNSAGTHLFANRTASAKGIISIDVTDPTAMFIADTLLEAELSGIVQNGDPFAYDPENDILYRSGPGENLDAIDCSNPIALEILGSVGTGPSFALTITPDFERGYLYLISATPELRVVDISDPASMGVVTSISISRAPASRFNPVFSAVHQYLFFCGSARFWAVDLSDPSTPVQEQTVTDFTNIPNANNIQFLNTAADKFYALGGGRIAVFDISVPSAVVRDSTTTVAGFTPQAGFAYY